MRDITRSAKAKSEKQRSLSASRQLLPANVRPVHYKLSFEPDLVGKAQSFEGTVVLYLFVLEKTTSISLHAVDLDIHETEILTSDGKVAEIAKTDTNNATGVFTIHFVHHISAPATLRLKQQFTGSLLHHGVGFFRSPVKDSGSGVKWILATHFEPHAARLAFPCFDEPGLKATFEVTLIAEPQFVRIGNMDVSRESIIISQGKSKTATTFNKTPLMSTYLVAFAIGEFNHLETNTFRVPIRVYAAKYMDIAQAKHALITASRCLDHFEKTFDLSFPLPKVDMLAVPGMAGAMENWGLVTYKESLILFNSADSSAATRQDSASVIAHELAHQWFGNITTTKHWDSIWLNEAFASWADTSLWTVLEPAREAWNNFLSKDYQAALALDSNRSSHPIQIVIEKDDDVGQIFDGITYRKGETVIRMIAGIIGEENFVKGVSNYLKKNSFGSSVTEDLWDSLSDVVGYDVGKRLGTWIFSSGYPVITVIEDEMSDHIHLFQQRFLSAGQRGHDDDDTIYPAPVRIKTESGIDRETMLLSQSTSIPMPKGFFKLNADQIGFYRVAYSEERFLTLGDNAKDGILSVGDKIGVLSDAFALAASDFNGMKTSTALTVLEKFSDESSYFVWVEMLSCINSVLDAWTFESDSVISSLKAFRRKLVQKQLEKLGWDLDKHDSHIDQMFKPLLFRNSADEPKIIKAAKGMFDKFIWGNDKALDPNLRVAVFSVVLARGGVEEVWLFFSTPVYILP